MAMNPMMYSTAMHPYSSMMFTHGDLMNPYHFHPFMGSLNPMLGMMNMMNPFLTMYTNPLMIHHYLNPQVNPYLNPFLPYDLKIEK